MVKVRWASSGFKGEGSSEKCPATAGNQVGRGGSGRKKKKCVMGWGFCVGPMQGNQAGGGGSGQTHFSLTYGLDLGWMDCPDGWILDSLLGACLILKQARM